MQLIIKPFISNKYCDLYMPQTESPIILSIKKNRLFLIIWSKNYLKHASEKLVDFRYLWVYNGIIILAY